MNKGVFIVIVSILLLIFPGQAHADGLTFDVNSDVEMDLRYDWTIDAKVIDSNYLSYPGSKLKPITKLLISYRMNPRFIEIPAAGKHIDYEELWYQAGQAIGCRRLHTPDIPETYQGAIRIMPSAATARNCGAVSGAIARLFLDLGLQNCVLSAVYIPLDIFTPVVDDLSRFHFYTNLSPDIKPLSLRLCSNPLSLTQVLFYNSGQ